MAVTLIAMTDVVMPKKDDGLYGEKFAAEYVCDHAARACTSADLKPLITEDDTYLFWEDDDKKALKAALKSGHESIIENAVYTFEIKGVSRALLAQLSRHRLISLAVQSQRYVNKVAFEYVTPESIRDNPNALEQYEWGMKAIQKVYNTMLSWGVDKEDARYILPNACTTNLVLTANARELRHIFALRTCTRAQEEIRELAEKMLKICKEVSPTIFEDAGPSCVRDGFCREQKSCHRAPKLEKVLEIMDEIDGLADIRDMQRTAERECH